MHLDFFLQGGLSSKASDRPRICLIEKVGYRTSDPTPSVAQDWNHWARYDPLQANWGLLSRQRSLPFSLSSTYQCASCPPVALSLTTVIALSNYEIRALWWNLVVPIGIFYHKHARARSAIEIMRQRISEGFVRLPLPFELLLLLLLNKKGRRKWLLRVSRVQCAWLA